MKYVKLFEQYQEDLNEGKVKVKGKVVNTSTIEIEGVNRSDGPDDGTADAFAAYAEFTNGRKLNDDELHTLTMDNPDLIYDLAMQQFFESDEHGEYDKLFEGHKWLKYAGTIKTSKVISIMSYFKKMGKTNKVIKKKVGSSIPKSIRVSNPDGTTFCRITQDTSWYWEAKGNYGYPGIEKLDNYLCYAYDENQDEVRKVISKMNASDKIEKELENELKKAKMSDVSESKTSEYKTPKFLVLPAVNPETQEPDDKIDAYMRGELNKSKSYYKPGIRSANPPENGDEVDRNLEDEIDESINENRFKKDTSMFGRKIDAGRPKLPKTVIPELAKVVKEFTDAFKSFDERGRNIWDLTDALWDELTKMKMAQKLKDWGEEDIATNLLDAFDNGLKAKSPSIQSIENMLSQLPLDKGW